MFSGRASLDYVDASGFIAPNSGGEIDAECAVAKDIAFTGGCIAQMSGPFQGVMHGGEPRGGGGAATHDAWECRGQNNSTTPFLVTARVGCIKVP